MGADIKALRTRIKSVDSTLHLTKAMGLVASSKIRRATKAMLAGREYIRSFEEIIRLLTACPECLKSPYMRLSGEDRLRIVVIAGDRGLAGGYNVNVFNLVRDTLAEHPEAEIFPIGKRACERYGKPVVSSESFSAEDAAVLAEKLCEDFAAGLYDRLCVVSTEYHSIMTQTAVIRDVLPLKKSEDAGQTSAIFEPDETSILNSAVTKYVAGFITAAARESFASEVAARRMAMDSAGKNAAQMIEDLQLRYNRARQGAITQEITEIVAGSGV